LFQDIRGQIVHEGSLVKICQDLQTFQRNPADSNNERDDQDSSDGTVRGSCPRSHKIAGERAYYQRTKKERRVYR
jgi:hypothetical protein